MSDIKLYNSLSRKKEIFTPINPSHIKMYVCGPTVYSYAHIGNARPAVVFDTLRRVLSHAYPAVTHVANITDIDDKIMDAAKAENVPISLITDKYAAIYNADMASLGVQKPTFQPKATDHVKGMVDMTQTLVDKGHAYENDGHVLFNVPSYKSYGLLSGRSRDEQIMGARVEVAPYKRDPADFVLWKPSSIDQPGWDSPWGRGRPGWHIECSVMAKAYLGDVFDIHGGGLDLTFPHHENEIAQSCCANGQAYLAHYWLHNGFVTVEGEKMSKSIGNVLLVHDMIKDGIAGEAIRFNLLSTHYRQPFDWTQNGLDNALKTLDKWYEIVAQAKQENDISQDFVNALYDDMNTPLAISELHHIAKNNPQNLVVNAQLLGFLFDTPDNWFAARRHAKPVIDSTYVEELIAKRNMARANKDYAESDRIRDELASMGVTIKDGANGTEWSVS